MARFKLKGLLWWIIGLLMLGSMVNYLTRSTLAVAAPTLLKDLHVTEQQYSWILNSFQATIMLQPFCGYVMDVIGLKLAFAIFATGWSLVCLAHGLAHNWQTLAGLRGLLGLAEGSANPAGMKATAEWFPAKEGALRAACSTSAHRSAPCWRRRWSDLPFTITIGRRRLSSPADSGWFG